VRDVLLQYSQSHEAVMKRLKDIQNRLDITVGKPKLYSGGKAIISAKAASEIFLFYSLASCCSSRVVFKHGLGYKLSCVFPMSQPSLNSYFCS